ncbi:MAG: ABC transporter substrate-binding protein [Pontibacterium sp.]
MSKAHCRFSQRLIIAIFFCAASLIGLPSQASSSQQERLISTDANATQILFKLGMGDKIIAVDVTSKLPAQADSLPNVGYHRRLSGEGLLSLNPSLVIGSNHMGPPEATEIVNHGPFAESSRQGDVPLGQVGEGSDFVGG